MQKCWEVQSCPFLEKVAVAKISENGCNKHHQNQYNGMYFVLHYLTSKDLDTYLPQINHDPNDLLDVDNPESHHGHPPTALLHDLTISCKTISTNKAWVVYTLKDSLILLTLCKLGPTIKNMIGFSQSLRHVDDLVQSPISSILGTNLLTGR